MAKTSDTEKQYSSNYGHDAPRISLKDKLNDLSDADLGVALALFARHLTPDSFWRVMDMPVRWALAYLNVYSIDDKGIIAKLQ